MSKQSSRFSKYAQGELAPLVKLEQDESQTGRLVGEHEYNGEDDNVFPVLEIVDAVTGREVAWRASAWHARERLELVDPQHGDVIRITRLADRGKSHQYKIEILESAAGVVEAAAAGEPKGNDDDIPF